MCTQVQEGSVVHVAPVIKNILGQFHHMMVSYQVMVRAQHISVFQIQHRAKQCRQDAKEAGMSYLSFGRGHNESNNGFDCWSLEHTDIIAHYTDLVCLRGSDVYELSFHRKAALSHHWWARKSSAGLAGNTQKHVWGSVELVCTLSKCSHNTVTLAANHIPFRGPASRMMPKGTFSHSNSLLTFRMLHWASQRQQVFMFVRSSSSWRWIVSPCCALLYGTTATTCLCSVSKMTRSAPFLFLPFPCAFQTISLSFSDCYHRYICLTTPKMLDSPAA